MFVPALLFSAIFFRRLGPFGSCLIIDQYEQATVKVQSEIENTYELYSQVGYFGDSPHIIFVLSGLSVMA